MLKEQRHQMILEYLEKKKYVKIEEFVNLTNASEITIRRDLQYLDEQNKLLKVHGGAQTLMKTVNTEFSIHERIDANKNEKVIIAAKAAKYIQDNTHIYLDAGTSTAQLIKYFENKNVIVYTHGVHHINELLKHNIKCFIIGGFIKEQTLATIGEFVISQIEQFQFDIAFLGTNAIDEEFGLSTPDGSEAIIKKTIIKQSNLVYVLADKSKFMQKSYVAFAKKNEITKIITN